MSQAMLEHVNVTVTDPQKTADMLCGLFGWHIRWQGAAISGGYTIHVGSDDSYVAVYSPQSDTSEAASSYATRGDLNHIGVVVEDLDLVEKRVKGMGFSPINHADYEPGRRFYFRDSDNIEIEVVSYEKPAG